MQNPRLCAFFSAVRAGKQDENFIYFSVECYCCFLAGIKGYSDNNTD